MVGCAETSISTLVRQQEGSHKSICNFPQEHVCWLAPKMQVLHTISSMPQCRSSISNYRALDVCRFNYTTSKGMDRIIIYHNKWLSKIITSAVFNGSLFSDKFCSICVTKLHMSVFFSTSLKWTIKFIGSKQFSTFLNSTKTIPAIACQLLQFNHPFKIC